MANVEQNRETAVKFLDLMINKKDPAGAAALTGPRYVQHNPHAADGADAMVAYLTAVHAENPGPSLDVKRTVAEGDFVVTHQHVKLSPEDRGVAVVDIFHFEDGKIVEHWDVLQPVPEETPKDNTMF